MSESATIKNASEHVDDKRQRSDYQRKRHSRHGGRKRSTRNVLTRELTEAVIEAAERVGSDLKGTDG